MLYNYFNTGQKYENLYLTRNRVLVKAILKYQEEFEKGLDYKLIKKEIKAKVEEWLKKSKNRKGKDIVGQPSRDFQLRLRATIESIQELKGWNFEEIPYHIKFKRISEGDLSCLRGPLKIFYGIEHPVYKTKNKIYEMVNFAISSFKYWQWPFLGKWRKKEVIFHAINDILTEKNRLLFTRKEVKEYEKSGIGGIILDTLSGKRLCFEYVNKAYVEEFLHEKIKAENLFELPQDENYETNFEKAFEKFIGNYKFSALVLEKGKENSVKLGKKISYKKILNLDIEKILSMKFYKRVKENDELIIKEIEFTDRQKAIWKSITQKWRYNPHYMPKKEIISGLNGKHRISEDIIYEEIKKTSNHLEKALDNYYNAA